MNKTCIKIKPKDREAFIPSLQFEYSDIQQPVVIERDDCYVISYYRELGYDQFEISDPWPYCIHCDILADIRGYICPQHICAFDENEKLRFEDVKDQLPEWAYMQLHAYCHGDVHWYSCGNDEMCPDAVLYVDPKDLGLGSERAKKSFTHCLRLLNGEQLYEHDIIEIYKKTREHDFFGMVAYLWEEDCTPELLSNLKGTPCEHELIDIEDIFTFY
jgi:hypothetical protein